MGKVGTVDECFVGVQHFEELVELFSRFGLVHRLRPDANMLAKVLARQAFEPGGLIADCFPVGVHMPHHGHSPELLGLGQSEFQIGELFEDAFADQGRGVRAGHEGATHARLHVVGGKADRSRR